MEAQSRVLRLAQRHAWVTLLLFTLSLWLFPIGYRSTRVCLLVGMAVLWLWGAFLVRRKRVAAFAILAAGLAVLAWLCLPGRPGDPGVLQRSYVQSLQQYTGTRYVWGGENRSGIDCSGLVRRGFINANLRTGILTLNPQLVRTAFALWWHDCSARALGEEFRGFTTRVAQAESINSVPVATLAPGDLAVTAGGVHVLAYLGDKTWIEADPGVMKVITVGTPAENAWFRVPVQLVRWRELQAVSGK